MIALVLGAALACDAPTTLAEVLDAVGRAEVAWSALDAVAFGDAITAERAAVGCLGEPVTVDGAASIHRAEALAAFLFHDEEGARAHFAAVRTLLPAWRLPSGLAPEGHPLRAVFDAAEPGGPTLTRPRADGVAWVEIDGRRTDEVPAARPYLVQAFGPDGGVRSTSMATGVPEAAPEAPPERPRRKTGRVVGALVLAGVAGGAFGLSAQQYDRYWDPTTPPSRLSTHRAVTNVSTGVGIGAATGAAGLALSAAVGGRF